MSDNEIDPTTLTEQQIRQAIITHCQLMGSRGYYIDDEMQWFRRDPRGIVVFTDVHHRVRAYHRRGNPAHA